MALSRRVGELWERFCSSAWDTPSKPDLQRIKPPTFEDVLDTIGKTLLEAAGDYQKNTVSNIFGDLREEMSRLLLKFVQQALLVEQATQPWPAVQGRS